MKKLKTMALIAMCMPFLSACSGSGSEDNSLYGQLPDRYEQFVKEKEQLREQAKDIKTEAEKKALIEKSEKMTETWKVKIEESAKALNGKPIKPTRYTCSLPRTYLRSVLMSEAATASPLT